MPRHNNRKTSPGTSGIMTDRQRSAKIRRNKIKKISRRNNRRKG